MGRVIIFDTETNGFAREHRIIDLTAMAVEGYTPIDNISTLVNSVAYISPQATKVHGIRVSDLIGKPKPEQVYPYLSNYINHAPIVGHSVPFDRRFLEKELVALGLPAPKVYIDTMQLARKLYPGLVNHKLQTVYDHLCGGGVVQQHRSLGDVMMTAEVWLVIKEEYKKRFGGSIPGEHGQ